MLLNCYDRTETQSVYFLFQGEAGKVGMPGFPGSDGVPVSREILTEQYIMYSCLLREERVEIAINS